MVGLLFFSHDSLKSRDYLGNITWRNNTRLLLRRENFGSNIMHKINIFSLTLIFPHLFSLEKLDDFHPQFSRHSGDALIS